ncbi:MAG: hypothetical protein A2045_13255 [Rhodocyclales bacterium GWA2_65_20]|nr:MAG: hypothetical protein A2045_13255 [Rhodocyclales bacterium GWA2_65_20]
MTEEQNDGRLSFDAAVAFVQQQPDQAAFAAMPVIGENSDAAEGARIFIVAADGAGSYQVRFVAGPFFANVFAANETLAPADVPERVKSMRFMPTRLEEEWLTGQVQILIQKLVQASGQAAPQMPDYANAPVVSAGADDVFPISFVGRPDKP